jgi:hypothetical protein
MKGAYPYFGLTEEQRIMRASVLALIDRVLPREAGRHRKRLPLRRSWPVDHGRRRLHHGAHAIMQRFFRDSRVGPIGGGSSEIQHNVMAGLMGD